MHIARLIGILCGAATVAALTLYLTRRRFNEMDAMLKRKKNLLVWWMALFSLLTVGIIIIDFSPIFGIVAIVLMGIGLCLLSLWCRLSRSCRLSIRSSIN